MIRVCLIVDNPLRDLDGLCLIANHLCQRGAEVFLVPMHLQGFDILSLRPDVVLVNYVRVNNMDLLKLYKQQGIRVAILDTEGIGEWWPKHAQLLNEQNINAFVDEYYCWGEKQANILKEFKSLDTKKIKITGCPRYDFITKPWRASLPKNDLAPKYFLINTNFPVVNPQYAEGSNAEIKGWVKVGWGSQLHAEAFANASSQVFENVKDAIIKLAKALPEETFVLRPHPFESIVPYQKLADELRNLKLRKQGTSLQWINHAKALLHVNCFTSIEAALMGVEPLSFEWINHKDIRQHSSEPFHISRNAKSVHEMIGWLRCLAKSQSLEALPSRDKYLQSLISNNYHAIDGLSAKRVASAILNLTDKAYSLQKNPIKLRQRLVHMIRKNLGYTGTTLIKNIITSKKLQLQRINKIPSVEDVREVMARIESVGENNKNTVISIPDPKDYLHPKQASFRSVKIISS